MLIIYFNARQPFYIFLSNTSIFHYVNHFKQYLHILSYKQEQHYTSLFGRDYLFSFSSTIHQSYTYSTNQRLIFLSAALNSTPTFITSLPSAWKGVA